MLLAGAIRALLGSAPAGNALCVSMCFELFSCRKFFFKEFLTFRLLSLLNFGISPWIWGAGLERPHPGVGGSGIPSGWQ